MSNKTKAVRQDEASALGMTPKLRFPEYRNAGAWEEKRLGDVCSFSKGKGISKADISPAGKTPCIRYAELYTTYNEVITNVVSKTTTNTNDLVLSIANDVIIPSSGETAIDIACASCVTQAGIALGGDLNIMRGEVDGIFLSYYLNNAAKLSIAKIAQGDAVVHLYGSQLSNLDVYLPSNRSEQKKIADCLSSIDELIAAQAEKLGVLKAHKKGLMQQLFPLDGETVPRLCFPEFRDAGAWEEKQFGEVATFHNGRAYKQEELLEQGKYRVLRVGNFFTNNEWYYSDLELDETKYCDDGDLLYAWSASFGPRIWHGERVIYHYHIWKVKNKKGVDKKFLFTILDVETEKMKSLSANGLGLLHITKGTIEGWGCKFPGVSEQQKIADCLSSVDEMISTQIQKLDTLKAHKKGLMQQLFPAVDEVTG